MGTTGQRTESKIGSDLAFESFLAKLLQHASPVLSIIGLAKHAGKTSFLQHLLTALKQRAPARPLALSSIGLDGEGSDFTDGRPKPRLYLPKHSLIATARERLAFADAELKLLEFSKIHSALGEILIAECLSDGFVELAGPAISSELPQIEALFRQHAPDALVLIDGALSRSSPAKPHVSTASVLAVHGEDCPSLAQFQRRLKGRLLGLCSPKAPVTLQKIWDQSPNTAVFDQKNRLQRSFPGKSLLGQEAMLLQALGQESASLLLKGSLHARLVAGLLKRPAPKPLLLLVEDPSKVLATPEQLLAFEAAQLTLRVRHTLPLEALALNPLRDGGGQFPLASMFAAAKAVSPVPIFALGPSPY